MEKSQKYAGAVSDKIVTLYATGNDKTAAGIFRSHLHEQRAVSSGFIARSRTFVRDTGNIEINGDRCLTLRRVPFRTRRSREFFHFSAELLPRPCTRYSAARASD